MAIQVQCPACQKRYGAPDSMAGRRVRCKYCAFVFPVTPAPDVVKAAAASSAIEPDDWTAPTTQKPGNTSAEPTNPFDAPGTLVESDAVFAQSFPEPVYATRPNHNYRFPTARELDRWLPVGMSVVGLLWLAASTIGSASGLPAWVGPLRLFLYAAIFFGIIFPLQWVATRIASRKLRFALPPNPVWRVISAFFLPFVLCAVIGMGGENVSSVILGAFLSAGVALAAHWLFLRLIPPEGAVTLGLSVVGYAVGIAASFGVLAGINQIATSIAEHSKSPTQLASSPIGPGFGWATRTPETVPEPTPPRVIATAPPETEPAAPVTQPAPQETPSPTPTPAAPLPPPEIAAVPPDPGLFSPRPLTPTPEISPVTPPPSDPTVSPPPPEPVPTPAPTNPNVAPLAPADTFVAGIRQAHSPLVVSANSFPHDVPGAPPLQYFIPTAVPSTFSLMRRVDATGGLERLELWSLSPAERRMVRPPFQAGPDHAYVVSLDGLFSARMIQFPSRAIELWSNTDNTLAKTILVPQREGRPTLLGFLPENRILLHWQSTTDAAESGVEVWDAKNSGRGRPIPLPPVAASPDNHAISPDGKLYATLARIREKPVVHVFALTGGAPRQLPILGLDSKWIDNMRGLAFSADSKRLAILFEAEGSGLVFTWSVADGRLIGQRLLAAGIMPPPAVDPPAGGAGTDGPHPARPRRFSWIGDSFWLIRGEAVINAETGALAGRIGAKDTIGQYLVGDTLLLTYKEANDLRIAAVKLDRQKLRLPDAKTATTQPTTKPR